MSQGTATSGGRDRTWLAAALVIAAAVVVELAFLAIVPVFVTTDGAAHVDGAAALVRLGFGTIDQADGYTSVVWLPATNLIPELPMAALAWLVGAAAAEKVVLGAWVVLLPMALYYAVTGIRRDAGWLAVLALPFTFGVLLQLGFYSFCFAALGFLLVAGYHARHGAQLGRREVVALALLLTLTYAAHAFVFAIAVLLLAVTEGWAWLVEGTRSVGGLARRSAPVVAAAAPALVLAGAAVVVGSGGEDASAGAGPSLLAFQVRALLESLALVLQLVVFDQREAVFAVLLAALFVCLGLLAVRSRGAALALEPRGGARGLRVVDGYLVFAAVLLLGVVLVSDAATLGAGGPGAFVTSRLALFAALAVVLWLAAHPFGSRARFATVAVVLVATVGLFGMRLPWYQRLSDHATAFASLAPCVAEEATMAQVNLARVELPSRRTDQISNETGRLTAATGGLDLGDAELGDGVHLVRYRTALDPYRYLRGAGGFPTAEDPVIDPERYEAATGGELDYVLLFGRRDASAEVLGSAEWTSLAAELERGYRRIAVVDEGLLEVYERLGTGAAAAGEARRAASAFCQEVGAER